MLSLLKDLIEFICAAIYYIYLSIFRNKPVRVLIYYHGIRNIEAGTFAEQMVYLAKNCIVVKPSEIKNSNVGPKSVIVGITFDDAFVSVMENAVPILREYGLPAGIFVPVGNLGQKPRWEMPVNCSDRDEIVMNEEQIAELDKDGFEIFSHTVSHPVLTKIDDVRLETELAESRRALERLVNHAVVGVSYPHGACDARVCNVAQRCGYKLGFTIEPSTIESNTDNLRIGRFSVSPRDSLFKFKLKVNGAYEAVGLLGVLKTSLTRYFGKWRVK